jgi:hypothetical protein
VASQLVVLGLEVKKMSPNIQWSDEEDRRLRSLAKSGLSLTEIAQQMQRGVSSVRSRARKNAIAIARDRNPMQAPIKTSTDLLDSG